MRKQKVLFLCTQNSARSQMAEGFLRHLAGDRFEVYSAGIDPTGEIHPCAVEAMWEVGIDISDQYPKGLRTYLGKEFFNYLIIVCARAEERCPKTFPGVGTRFSWIFEDPRREEDIPYDSMLERFRKVRDEIELKIKDWLEHPEEELAKLRAERESERAERMRAARSAREQRTELEALLQRPQRSHPTSAAATRHAPLLGSREHAIRGLA
jgi:arsenate reductase (thioredoxin)